MFEEKRYILGLLTSIYYRPFRSGVSVVILSVMSVFSFVWVAGFVELAARSANRMFFFAAVTKLSFWLFPTWAYLQENMSVKCITPHTPLFI